MGLIDIASGNSAWRGLDYAKEHKVISYKKISNFGYEGIVNGSNDKKYNVFMNNYKYCAEEIILKEFIYI